MPQIILHHYALSTFSEKVRLALGLKGLAYGSVDVAPMPPRPLLNALTGGYRKVPVLRRARPAHPLCAGLRVKGYRGGDRLRSDGRFLARRVLALPVAERLAGANLPARRVAAGVSGDGPRAT